MERVRCSNLLAAVALLVPLSVMGQGMSRVFSCEVHGRQVFGDTLPKECYGHAWVEKINNVVVYREAAQPTPDESALRREQAQQRDMAQKEATRQKRQREALLGRYPTVGDLDRRRDAELAELDKAIGELRNDEAILAERRSGLDDKIKALGNKPVPDDLRKALSYADEELTRAKKAIDVKVNERDSLQQRFDDDRRLYIEITAQKGNP